MTPVDHKPERKLLDDIESMVHQWLCDSGYNARRAQTLAEEIEHVAWSAVKSYEDDLARA